jgi:putative hydrolase of the HAD superfamily
VTKALLFDLDETLMHEAESVAAAFGVVCTVAQQQHGLDPDGLERSVRAHARALWESVPIREWCLRVGTSSFGALTADFAGSGPELAWLRDWAPHYRREAWRRGLADNGVDDGDLAASLATRFAEQRERLHVPFPEAEQVLQAFCGGPRLGLLTNGFPAQQRAKLSGAGLTAYFDAIVVSGELGFGKPDPRAFEVALRQLGVAAEPTWMIGDSLVRDIAGAKAVGMKTVWINRTGEPPDDNLVPDAEIRDLTELEKIVQW